jgi:two-component system response regulator RpaA
MKIGKSQHLTPCDGISYEFKSLSRIVDGAAALLLARGKDDCSVVTPNAVLEVMSADILVVDDQAEVTLLVAQVLRHEGYQVRTASTGKEALEMISQKAPKLLILDVMMPEMDGWTLCRRLREDFRYQNLPILILSSLNKTEQIVKGLNAGADDYICKPFEPKELAARVRAQLRRVRSEPGVTGMVLRIGDLVLDGKAYELRTSKVVARLTATEYRLVRYMIDRPNQVVTYSDLLQAVWSYPPNSGDADLVRTHMRNVRAKMDQDPNTKRYLQTVHGVGYMFCPPNAEQLQQPRRGA